MRRYDASMRAGLTASLLGSVLGGGGCVNGPPAQPDELPAPAIPGSIAELPGYAPFGLSGLAFFRGDLYAGSNIGLLRFSGPRAVALYRWTGRRDYVISRLAAVPDGAGLWFWHTASGWLTRLDATGWHNVLIPAPDPYYTRGDFLAGFPVRANAHHVTLVAGGRAFVWNPITGRWERLEQPDRDTDEAAVVIAALPVGDANLLVLRGERVSWGRGGRYVYAHTLAWHDGAWRTAPAGEFADIESYAVVGDAAFVATETGAVLRLSRDGAEPLTAPGPCDALATTRDGELLASFVGLGVHLLDGAGWNLVFSLPHDRRTAVRYAYLAEDAGKIAYYSSTIGRIWYWDGAALHDITPSHDR